MLAFGLLAAAGTAAAQGTPDRRAGAYGGATYGGMTAAVPAVPAAPPAAAPPVAVPKAPPIAIEPTYAAPPPMEVARQQSLYDRWGIAVTLGGGPEGFASPSNTGTDTGGGWNVRATIGTKSLLGFEASYFGSAQPIDALGLDPNAVLLGNGLQGSMRLNLTRQYDVGLFLLGGMAWRHYSLSNVDTNTSDVTDSDNVLELPIGAGVQYVYRGFLFDARAGYRFTQYGNMMATASNSDMSRWGVQGNIGYQF